MSSDPPSPDRLRRRLIGPDHFGGLLALIVGLILLSPLLADRREEGLAAGLITGLLLVGALVTSGAPRRVVVPVAIGAAALVTVAASGPLTTDGASPAWVYAIIAALLVATPVLVLRRVLSHRRVTLATVAGALCAYLLVGVAFSAVYQTVEAVDAQAFDPPLAAAATYYSFVTLTTLGYGDYVAVGDLARSLAVLEAVVGQVLLVTLVARFVSTLGQRKVRPPRSESPDVGEAGGEGSDLRSP